MKAVDFEVVKVARRAAHGSLSFFNEMMRKKEKSGSVSTLPIGVRALKSEVQAAASFQLRFFNEMMSRVGK